MARDLSSTTPLWIAALSVAIWMHMGLGGGGYVVGVIHEDHRALQTLGLKARERVLESEQTFDVMGLGSEPKAAEAQPPPPPPPPPKPPPEKKEKLVAKQDQPPPKKEEAKKAEEKKKVVLVEKKDEEKKKVDVQPLKDNRIAVRQHVKPDQADNPNAHFVGDEANHVEQETVATQTSHDQDDPNPTPGGNHPSADQRMGDSSQTKIAESDEHRGEERRAPGEKGTEFDVQKEPMPLKPMGPVAMVAPPSPVPPVSGGDGRAPQAPNVAPTPQLAPGQQQSGADLQSAPNGDWSFAPTRPGAPTGIAQMQGPGQNNPTNDPAHPASPTQWLGLGGHPGPGQVNLNLNPQGIVAVVGQDQLRKEREADGERRKSEHRGSWIASNFERWRSAIENYVSSVKPGNQTALNTAAVPFATYLNGMHNRIHPIFADDFLSSLDALPASHPMNDPKMFTRLEIVLSRDGHLVKMGIVKTSGVTAFDIAALDSVQRASPFGSAPSAIVSPDGRVYLHWEFHRDEVYACSTMNARPFLLNVPPKDPNDPNPGPSTPQPPAGPQERGAPPANTRDVREGWLPVRDLTPHS